MTSKEEKEIALLKPLPLKLPPGLRTRFAPSPTGYLHLGHVASAIFVWGIALAHKAEVLLRIEDHDSQRCRPEFARALLEDLTWLGLLELSPTLPTISRQSEHPERYAEAHQQLARRELVYPCHCSRKTILARIGPDQSAYDGFCRPGGKGGAAQRAAEVPAGSRLTLAEARYGFADLYLGPQVQDPARESGDLLVRERNGNWTYNFCVVVDDLLEDIDLIIRGQDILESTGRQLQLRELLQAGSADTSPPPRFLHHPLIWESEGRKLSKRYGSTSLRQLRAEGLSAADLLGMAAQAVGLQASERPLQASQLGEFFV